MWRRGRPERKQVLNQQDRQRRESGETPTSAATELTHSCSDGNSNTSSHLTQIPLSTASCVTPSSRKPCRATPEALGPPGFSLAPASSCLTSSYPGAGPTSSTVCTGWGMGVAKKEAGPRSPVSQISPVGQGLEEGPGLEGPDTGTWAQKNRAFLFSFSTAHGCVF